MLERVEAERDHRGGAVGAAYTKNAALLAELVVVERMGRQHDAPARWGRQLGSGNWRAYRSAGGKCRPLVWPLSRSRCLQAPAGCPKSRAPVSAARQHRPFPPARQHLVQGKREAVRGDLGGSL